MATAVSCLSLFLSPAPRPLNQHRLFISYNSHLSLIIPAPSLSHPFVNRDSHFRRHGGRIVSSIPVLTSGAESVQNSQELASTAGDRVSSVISALLFAAFIGLSVLTVGVIYLAVTDFLRKRESDKFEKEEASKKKSKRKGKIANRAKAGPRGFGQRIVQEDDEED
ncbi:unnamed protein product [Cuscuta epithymum]|uniref:Transmembrane protein n=1 Tax=Cuscuta epithymum TaxID=186058 RepID=A0AAV0G9B6_9ASTE|nr:unnamed protein product [Cuscuta epithymum]